MFGARIGVIYAAGQILLNDRPGITRNIDNGAPRVLTAGVCADNAMNALRFKRAGSVIWEPLPTISPHCKLLLRCTRNSVIPAAPHFELFRRVSSHTIFHFIS